jgi:acetyl-CoA C-acetyltransferase
MPYVASVGTDPPTLGGSRHRVVGDDEDAVAQVHECFTGVELISYEDLGFGEPFGTYLLRGPEETTIGGALPVNTSRALKGQGPARSLGAPTAVSAVTILEGPVAHGR